MENATTLAKITFDVHALDSAISFRLRKWLATKYAAPQTNSRIFARLIHAIGKLTDTAEKQIRKRRKLKKLSVSPVRDEVVRKIKGLAQCVWLKNIGLPCGY